MDTLISLLEPLQSWLFTHAIQPLLFILGLMSYEEQSYDGILQFLIGLASIVVVYALMRPLEALWPVEHWRDRHGIGVDIIYTALSRLGVLPLFFFFVLSPIDLSLDSWLRFHNFTPLQLETLFPGLWAAPLLSFFGYLVVLDFFGYWQHRLQHKLRWWWALHVLHHSQRKLSFWSDNRNHVLDDCLTNLLATLIALLIGTPPAQFIGILLLRQFVESLSHANVRLSFGVLGERVLVSPHFHRIHHARHIGYEGRAKGCNFAVLFPVWDVIFGTANFSKIYPATGVHDETARHSYGQGFWEQQWLGVKRLASVLR